jgi:hypothetical protein
MFVTEIFNLKNTQGYRTEKDDQSVQKFSDLRKTRLTLAQIKKLRLMNDLKKFEQQQKIEGLSKQYKPAAPAGPGF